ncbi:MAG TPA: trypsin-like peptidase domain-containing protein [Thermoleophilaceae bacterium]|nr:trypsin-like peptidase domain-containing protein [Thermoleophilaceae bacterium]
MRRATALAAALAAGALAGCSVDEGDGESAQGPSEVSTTRVKVVEGIGESGGFDPAQIYRRLSPGVVTVLSIFEGGDLQLGEDGTGGQGSGFVLDGEGYVATNAHVVTGEDSSADRAEDVYVEFSDGNRVAARIVGVDLNADVALLKVDPSGLSITPLRLGFSKSITVGEPVAAIGSPFGERQSLSVGVISAVDRNIASLTRFGIGDAIQTDAAINPGNSGGPLLDAKGAVLGINAQIKTESGGGEGVGFAIPVDAVRRSLRELRAKGRVDYAYLGVTTLSVWPQLADRIGAGAAEGALVQRVEDGSPAEDVGLEAGDDEITFQGQPDIVTGGDLIVAVDGRPITRSRDLTDAIGAHAAGDEVTLSVLRDGRRRSVRVELGGRPARSDG